MIATSWLPQALHAFSIWDGILFGQYLILQTELSQNVHNLPYLYIVRVQFQLTTIISVTIYVVTVYKIMITVCIIQCSLKGINHTDMESYQEIY